MRSRFFIPASLIIATLVLLVSLGFWQLDRADEKRAIEGQIDSANSGDVNLIDSAEFLKDKEYYHVRLQGRILATSNLFMTTKSLIRFQAIMF